MQGYRIQPNPLMEILRFNYYRSKNGKNATRSTVFLLAEAVLKINGFSLKLFMKPFCVRSGSDKLHLASKNPVPRQSRSSRPTYWKPWPCSSGGMMVGRNSSMLPMAFCMITSNTHSRGRHSSSISFVDGAGKYLGGRRTHRKHRREYKERRGERRRVWRYKHSHWSTTWDQSSTLSGAHSTWSQRMRLTVCSSWSKPSKCVPPSCKQAERESRCVSVCLCKEFCF